MPASLRPADRDKTLVRLLRRVATLGLGDGASRILGLAAAALLARTLGVQGFGIFASAMSVALIVSVGIDFGQNILVGRLIARDEVEGRASVVHVAVNKIGFTLLAAAATPAIALALGVNSQEAAVLGLMVLWGGGLSIFDSLRATARSAGLFQLDSLGNGLESCLRVIGVGLLSLNAGSITAFAAWHAAEAAVATIIMWVVLHDRISLPWRKFEAAASVRILREAYPIGVSSLGLAGFYRLDQVLVRGLSGPEAAGLYGAAARLALSANAVGGIVMMAAFPDLVRARDRVNEFSSQARHALRTSAALGLCAAVALFISARAIVTFLYGSDYIEAVFLLRILSIVVFFNPITVFAQQTANALGREGRVATIVLALAGLVVAVNVALIPLWGAVAAAVVSAAAEATMAGFLLFTIRDRLWPKSGGTLTHQIYLETK